MNIPTGFKMNEHTLKFLDSEVAEYVALLAEIVKSGLTYETFRDDKTYHLTVTGGY